MPPNPSQNKKDYRLCLCISSDCKGQKWEGNDGSINDGKWCHQSTEAKSAGDPANSDDDVQQSVGSRDSTDESDGASAGSFIEDDEGAAGYDEQAFRSEYASDHEASFVTTSYNMDLEAEIFGDDSD
ncbi:hypothetical protein B0H10DRAFT_2200526 [Mycena sp. CBHHK59/15]|nr:hypothetical protein B0H10DRAFT_2200526 [Mycena sp. CBHHK59/15]